jgi:hypothetical protein
LSLLVDPVDACQELEAVETPHRGTVDGDMPASAELADLFELTLARRDQCLTLRDQARLVGQNLSQQALAMIPPILPEFEQSRE